MEFRAVRWYCSDCGAGLPAEAAEGCCTNRDWRIGEPVRARVMGALAWSELHEEEQALTVTLLTFPDRAAGASELLSRLHWTGEMLAAVVAPAGQDAARMACAIRIGETVTLTDHARDAFFNRLLELGEQILEEYEPAL